MDAPFTLVSKVLMCFRELVKVTGAAFVKYIWYCSTCICTVVVSFVGTLF